jgi:catechol 2,3-dioxygenase-like lactoylglutathione lyase family enzyme
MVKKGPLSSAKMGAFIAAKDAKRAIAFYRDKLGLPVVRRDEFAVEFDANGTPLRVQLVQKISVAPYTVLGWEVKDIAAAVQGLQQVGITCERFRGMDQDELAVWTAPGGARIAWFKDPEGHILSVAEF